MNSFNIPIPIDDGADADDNRAQTPVANQQNNDKNNTIITPGSSGSKLASKFLLQSDLAKMERPELIRHLTSLEIKVNKTDEMNVDLRAKLLSITEERDLLRKKTNDALTGEKLQQIQEQIMQKDSRVMELNNVILEKERQIIDLQEMCSEQGKVAQSKSLAFGIMNRKLREFDAKQKRDASTETDFNEYSRGRNRSASPRRNSPGRAIPQFRMATSGNGSPPPIDPAEDGCSSYTTETMNNEGNDTTSKSKKFRKKVTFDVDNAEENARSGEQAIRPARRREQPAPPNAAAIATFDYEEMLIENDHLRQVISEMEKTIQSQQQQQKKGDMKTTAKSESLQILKTKAAAQAQIKKLEGMIEENKQRADIEIAELKAMVEQINESREWILNENAKIQDQLSIAQQKCDDLHEELDASLNTTDLFRKKLDDSARRLDATMTECYQSRALVQQISDEKAIMGSEVERLKEAIFAQDEFISLLEGDLIVYEAHVGILRDSLGASKKEDRQHIKSKAFSAKISALESEKQEIAKKNNEEKLRAKALTIKLRFLEEERDALKGKLRHYERQEMAGNDSANANAETQIQMQTSPMIPDESNCLKLNEMEEQIALKTAQIESLIGQSQHLEQQIRQISTLLEMTSSIVNCIFQSFVQEPNENNENSFTAVEDLPSKLELIQRKLVQNSEEIKAMHQSRNALFEELSTKQNQISELTANLAHTIEANQKAELELQKLGDQHEQALNKITQNEQMISSFERRNVDLTMEISRNKASLESAEAERNMLADEKLSLENSTESMGNQIEELHTINEKLQENLRSTNAQSELLSAQLAEQKRRQEKLLSVLSDIVNRFKEGTILDATFSDASLDQFIARMGGIGCAATQGNNENDDGASAIAIPNTQQNLPEIPSHQAQQEPTPNIPKMEESENRAMRPFSKSVYVQVNLPSADVKEEEEMARRRNLELEELRRNLAEEHEQKISANFEVEAIHKKLIENEESLKQIVTQKEELVAERDDLYDQLTVQRELLEKERENIRNLPLKNAKEEEEVVRMELAQLQRSLAEEKKQKMSAEYEVETIRNKLIETEENLKEIVTQKEELAAERNDLYDQLIVQRELLEKELGNAQGVHSILVEQFNELRHKVDEFEHEEREKAEQRENAMNYFVETHTQTETPMTNDQFVQPDKMEWDEKMVQTEAEKSDPQNAITQTDQLQVFMSKTQAEEEEKNIREIHHAQNQSAAEVCMIRQESHQLLMDCIQDREEFERHLGDNVQQLMELKSELESSVDVLKGEIWSLNLELKKRFNERDCLKGRVHELEEQIAHYKTQNDELLGGIQAKNGEMADLKEMLERSMENGRQIQTKFEESHSLLAEKTRKSDVLLARLKQILLDNPSGAIPGLRAELEQLKELQYQWRRETGESLQAFSANVLQQFNAAKLTTQKCENGALIRENAELIEMNARLQTELNQLVSLQQGNIGPHNGNQSIRQMDKVLAEAELNVQIERDADDALQNGGANDELAKAEIIMPLQMKMALEVDIDLGSIIGEEQRKDEEKWQDGDEANDENKKDLQRIEDEDAVAKDGFEIGMMNEEEVMKLDATKKDEEGNEALKTEERKSDEKEEASNDIEEEETKTTEDWNWNDAEEEEEEETTMGDEGEAEMKDEGHHEKQTLKIEIEEVPKAVKQDANAEDWNWSEDDGEEEDEEEEKQQPKRINDDKHPQAATDGNADKTGHTAAHIGSIEPKGKTFGQQPKTDEWAWNEDEDDDENDEENDDDDKVINSGNSGSKSKPEQSNVKQLFEDW